VLCRTILYRKIYLQFPHAITNLLFWLCNRRDLLCLDTSRPCFDQINSHVMNYDLRPSSHIIWQIADYRFCYAIFSYVSACTRLNRICLDQWRRSRCRAGEAVKKLRAMETYEKQKYRYQYACFCLATMSTSETTIKIVENQSEFSGCANGCNKFVSIRS